MGNPFQLLIDWLTGEQAEKVSAKSALTLPALWYGVNKIAGHCGRLPLFIHKKLKDGGSEKATDFWAYDKLKLLPNEFQTADVFREMVTAHAILWGNGRVAIINPGRPDAEFIPLMPDRTRTYMIQGQKYHVTQPADGDRLPELKDFFAESRKTIVFTDAEVIHIPGLMLDGAEGLGIVSCMARALGIGISQDKHTEKQSSEGFSGRLLLEAGPGQLKDEKDARAFLKLFQEMHAGAENAGKVGLLREGMKAHVLNISNKDAEFLDSRRFSRQDACLMLGLSGLPGDGDNHSYDSKEMEGLEYLDNALSRWLSRWEFQIDAKVLTERERNEGYYSRFNTQAVLRTDAQTQASVISIYRACGVYSGNDARAILDMNPYDGGDSYENPNTTSPGGPSNQPKNPAKQSNSAQNAVEMTLRSLLKTEANNAKNGAKKPNFCDWIDKNYAKWEAKLADKLEQIGLDRDLATEHCNESRELLLNVAGDSKPDELEAKVAECVAAWEERVYSLLGALENA